MLDQLKWYLVNVGIKKYAPIGIMAAMSAFGSLMLAHAGLMESWGINYIASWSADWLTTHPISGPILLIELDTTSTALLALLIAGITILSRAGEHHTMANVPTAPKPDSAPPSVSPAAKAAIILLGILLAPLKTAQAFNLWHDIQQNTQWTLGSNAAAGTAVALEHNDALGVKAGQYVPSFLAQISQYRFLSAWWGGNEIKQPDGTQKLFDTAKVGFNVAYIFTGFVNQPPDLIKRLVVGPSVTVNLISTPHVFVPFFDINYQFGQTATNTQPPATLTPPPPTASRLNLFYEPQAG